MATGWPIDFFGRVSEQVFGSAIPGHDDPVEVFADDRVVGGFDNRHELLGGSLGTHARNRETELARESQREIVFGP